MSIDPRTFNAPTRPTLSPEDAASVGQAVLTLTKELWVLADRMAILEAVLERYGISVLEEIDSFQPDEAMQAEIDVRGKALVEAVLGAMAGGDERSE